MQMINNKLTAAEGMTLTNGSAFGKTVYLGAEDTADQWCEINDLEAEIRKREMEEAAAKDYEAALAEMGVAV